MPGRLRPRRGVRGRARAPRRRCSPRGGAADGAERLRFPPLLPRRQLETSGYLHSFPHLAGTRLRVRGRRGARRAMQARARQPPRGLERVPADDRAGADAGRLLPGVSGDRRARAAAARAACSSTPAARWVFRHEPSRDPARRQMFHQHELVRIGEPEAVLAWRDEWARARPRAAARPRARRRARPRQRPVLRPRRAHARRQPARAGAEVRAARPDRRPRADGAGLVQLPPRPLRRRPTGSSSPTAASPTPRASGFGHERIVLALLRTHGLDPATLAGRGAAELWSS